MARTNGKQYDIVVFGATGFTGKLVCQYLLSHPEKPSWAVAGRSASRLSSLKQQLNLPATVGILEAETSNYPSLVRMTSQAGALVNIVGPFRPFKAEEVVRACIETNTHYLDLSGETGFNADIIGKFHLEAQAKNLVVVPSSGFDSLPFDLSTYLAVKKAKALTAGKSDVKLAECAYNLPPDLSAGTLASAISMASEKDQLFPVRGDWLSPVAKPASLAFEPARYLPHRGKWGAQTAFTYHNTRMVNRTWGLLEHDKSRYRFGPAFQYKEGLVSSNRLVATMIGYFGAVSIWLLMNLSVVRWLASKSKKANSGPSEKSQAEAILKLSTLATANDGAQAICTMRANGHAGYNLTAKMIVEAALTVLEPVESRDLPLRAQGGVLTPALIGAERLAERLVANANFHITVDEYKPVDRKRD